MEEKLDEKEVQQTDGQVTAENQPDNQHENKEENKEENQTEQPDALPELDTLNAALQEQKEKYIRLYAEFDNFKRRNAKERIELIQTAGRDVIQSMLEVVDDCDRAEKQMQKTDDIVQLREGIQLIFTKLRNTLSAKGVKEMKSIGEEFNPDLHEAITEIPVTDESMKGKVVDEVEKGYTLNDKIIRFSKVVVGK
jgi:molecular chaperone GrpE